MEFLTVEITYLRDHDCKIQLFGAVRQSGDHWVADVNICFYEPGFWVTCAAQKQQEEKCSVIFHVAKLPLYKPIPHPNAKDICLPEIRGKARA